MTLERQLILDFEHRAAMGGDDFLVAPCNRKAVAWIDRWPEWSPPMLVVHGPAGCGKTHLAEVFRAKALAKLVEPEVLSGEKFPEIAAGEGWLIDDAEAVISCQTEEPILHLYNAVKEASGTLLLTGYSPPSRWTVKLPDLRSRLNSASSVSIGAPDDSVINAVLVKMFADRQVAVDPDVIDFAILRMERTFSAARNLVARADALALAERRRITVPLIRRILSE